MKAQPQSWQPTCSLAALQARSEMLYSIREFFHARGVIEVQTPCIDSCTVTEPAIESLSVPGMGYLQTSPEYQLKRLLAAGAPSLYQLGPVFRAGEAGRLHNPEFTMLEWYRLGYSDAELMVEVAELVTAVLGPGETTTRSYAEVVGLSLSATTVELDLRYAQGIEALGPGRVFVVDYPAEQAALARLRPEDASLAARFELCIDGVEVANGYWELTDSTELTERFETDLATRRQAGLELPEIDRLLLDAMHAGLPDCAGVALGVDRLLMLKLGADSLADVMPFPAHRS
jgi:lysyl-tRNA synthetase class 2